MKVLTLNINGGAAFCSSKKVLKRKLVDKILEQGVDVIVLTEFVLMKGVKYLFDSLEINKYLYFNSNCSCRNGILIAKKKI